MRIHLIRHGITPSNELKRYTGWKDVSISKKGKLDLIKLKDTVMYPKFDYVVSSPLKRCIETFNILFEGKEINTYDDDLRETNFGDWEGKSYQDLKNDSNYQKWINDIEGQTPPNGENYLVFKNRVINSFNKIITYISNEKHEDTLIVTHGGVIRVLMEHFGDSEIPFFQWEIPNGLGYTLEIYEETTYKKII